MSSILRFFRDRGGKAEGKKESGGTNPDQDEGSQNYDPSELFHERFSTDASGQQLQKCWDVYVDEKNASDDQKGYIIQDMISTLIDVYDGTMGKNAVADEISASKLRASLAVQQPLMSITGHPSSFVTTIISHFFQQISDIGKKGEKIGAVYDFDEEVQALQSVSINSYLQLLPGESIAQLKARRNKIRDTFRGVAILTHWSHNCAVIYSHFEASFARTMSTLAKELLEQVISLINISSTTNDHLDGIDSSLESEAINLTAQFSVQCLFLVLHIILNAIAIPKLDFVDLLPAQPHSYSTLQDILNPSNQWNDIILDTSHGLSGSLTQHKKLKADYEQSFIYAGCLKYFMEVMRCITDIYPVLMKNTKINEEIKISIGAVEIEALFGLVCMCTTHSDLVPSEPTLFEPVKNAFEMVQSGSYFQQHALFIRKQLLCLRINSWLLAKLKLSRPDSSYINSRLLSANLIGCFFRYLSSKYDYVRSQGDWIETMARSSDYEVSVSIDLTVYSTRYSHDLWPWKKKNRADADTSKSRDIAAFHILRKDMFRKIQENIKALPGYCIWESVVSEVLGSYMLLNARTSSNITSKVNKDNLRYVYEAFDALFRSRAKSSIDTETNTKSMSIPLSQLKFIEFISQLFKAADASNIFSIISDFETFRFLLGDKFLLAHSSFTNSPGDVFESIVIDKKQDGQLIMKLSKIYNAQYDCLYIWLYLQCCVMDYFHGLVIYSLYFQTDHHQVHSFLSYEDILLVLAQYLLSLSKNNKFPGHIIYQISSLVMNLNDIVLSMAYHNSKAYLLGIIDYILEVFDYQLKGKFKYANEDHAVFELTGCFAIMQLFLYLTTSNHDFSAKDIFLPSEQSSSHMSNLQINNNATIYIDMANEINNSVKERSSSLSVRETRYNLSTDVYSSPTSISISKPGYEANEKGLKIRASLRTVIMLLLNDYFHTTGLRIVQSIIIACAYTVNTIERSGNMQGEEERSKMKLQARLLAAEVMSIVLHVLAVSYKHPNRKFSLTTARNCIEALITLLRDEKLITLRIYIQDFIRRENLIYELLRALTKTLNGHENIRIKMDDTNGGLSSSLDAFDESCRSILYSGLTFVNAIVSNNEACKNALRLLLSSSREKVGSARARYAASLVERKEKITSAITSALSQKSASGLVSLILCAEKSPDYEVIVILYDLLLDGNEAGREYLYQLEEGESLLQLFRNQDEKPTIKNTAILQDLFQLIPYCDEKIQKFAIESFRNLISGRGALVNLTVCAITRPIVFDIVLDLFPYVPETIQSCNAELLDLLGRYVVTVSSLKHLFRILQLQDGLSPPYAWRVIQALQGMFLEEFGPKHTFVLDGVNSGLKLPSIYKWPKLKGLTFTCWLRVESQNNIDYEDTKYMPEIFSLRNEEKMGFELNLKHDHHQNVYHLHFAYVNEYGALLNVFPRNSQSLTMEICEGKWYFVALSISSGGFYNRGEIKLAVNDIIYTEDMGVWKLPESIAEPIIGDVPVNLKTDQIHRTFRGQMGAIYFFHEALLDQQLKGIYQLGPDYIYNFEPYSAGYKELLSGRGNSRRMGLEITASQKKTILDDGQLTNKILLAYNPVVLRGKFFLDNTPEKNEVYWKIPNNIDISHELQTEGGKNCRMHAMRLPGTYRSATQDVRLAMNSLGGIKVIIPLFAQLNNKIPIEGGINANDAKNFLLNDNLQLNPNFFPAILGLFTTLMEDNEENRRIFQKVGGFALIASFLEYADDGCFNLITLNQFVAIFENLKTDEVLKETCFDCILCNFRLWSRSALEVQICWLDWVINAVSALDLNNVSMYSAQRFIDTFYYHYDYQPVNVLSNSVHGISGNQSPSPKSKQVHGYEGSNMKILHCCLDSDSDIKLVRSKIFMCIRVTMIKEYSSGYESIVMLMKYLLATVDIRSKIETLEFITLQLFYFEQAYPDKLPSLLVGCSFSDSMICIEPGLHIHLHYNITWYERTVEYITLLCRLFTKHSNEIVLYHSKIQTRHNNISGNNSRNSTVLSPPPIPLKSQSSDEMPQQNELEELSLLKASNDFVELCNFPATMFKFSQYLTSAIPIYLAESKEMSESGTDLVVFTCSHLIQMMLGVTHSSAELKDINLGADNITLFYPALFLSICKVLKSNVTASAYRNTVLQLLCQLLTENNLKEICYSCINIENELIDLLSSLAWGTITADNVIDEQSVLFVFKIIVTIVRWSLCMSSVAHKSSQNDLVNNPLPSGVIKRFVVRISSISKPDSLVVFLLQTMVAIVLTEISSEQNLTPSSVHPRIEALDMDTVNNIARSLLIIINITSRYVSMESKVLDKSVYVRLYNVLVVQYPSVNYLFGSTLEEFVNNEDRSKEICAALLFGYIKVFTYPFTTMLKFRECDGFEGIIAKEYARCATLLDRIKEYNAGNQISQRDFNLSIGSWPMIQLRLHCNFCRFLLQSTGSTINPELIIPVCYSMLDRTESIQSPHLSFEKVYFIFISHWLNLLQHSFTLKLVEKMCMELHDLLKFVFKKAETFDFIGIFSTIFGRNATNKNLRYDNVDTDAIIHQCNLNACARMTQSTIQLLIQHGIVFPTADLEEIQKIWIKVTAYLIAYSSVLYDTTISSDKVVVPIVDSDSLMKEVDSNILTLSKPRTLSVTVSKPFISDHIASNETVRVYDTLRSHKHNLHRCEVKKARLLSQLANERGPWGYANDHKREVYWTLDNNENNYHGHVRLKRNLLGTRHTIATLKSIGKTIQEEQSANSNIMLSSIDIDMKKYTANTKRKTIEDEENMSDGEDDMEDLAIGLSNESDSLSILTEVISIATNSSGGKTMGKLDLSRLKLSFYRQNEAEEYDFVNKTGNHEFLWACTTFPSTTWQSTEIVGVYRRYYQLRYVAIEIFLSNRTSVFFNLYESSIAKRAYIYITRTMKTPNLNMIFTGRPHHAITRMFTPNGMTVTQAWVARKITNFEYLVYLNFIAGRTYNDLAQYPVFPWVLADYSSSKLDLKDPAIYRKFERPMGAQLESQREMLVEKYASSLSMQDSGFYPYHCGSHYSTSAMVIWYLIRLEPFTSYHVWLQDGKFDRPDRLFHSLDGTFHGCTTNSQDVKELIPEFFYNPEFLSNLNQVQLGARQDGEALNDVVLPKWAKDPVDFIRQHREALESEYVSSHLHNWIDLIFGCKQRPPFLSNGSDKAVQACNIFYHLSYLDAVDLDEMKASDPDLYDRTLRQIDNYGQTPCQLFTKDHPRRKTLQEVQDILWPIASVVPGAESLDPQQSSIEKPKRLLCYGECKVSNVPVLFIADCSQNERLVTIDSNRILGYHTFIMRNPSHVPPFSIKLDKIALNQAMIMNKAGLSSYLPYSATIREKLVGVPFASPVVLNPSFIENIGRYSASAKGELIGTKENKAIYIEEEVKVRGRYLEDSGNSSVRRLMKSSSSSSLSAAFRQASSTKDLSGKDESRQSIKSVTSNAVDESTSRLTKSAKIASNTPSSKSSKGQKIDKGDYHLSSHLFCYLPALKLIFSCGHWDNAFKATSAESGKLVQSISHHREVVTCISCASDYNKHYLAAGSKDCTVTIWEVVERETEPVHVPPLHTLYGHDDAVNCVVIQAELDIVVSGSDDGTIMIHSLREGSYIRSIVLGGVNDSISSSPTALLRKTSLGDIALPSSPPAVSGARQFHQQQYQHQHFITQQAEKTTCRVHLLAVSKEGNLIAYSNDGFILASYTLNGRFMRLIHVRERLHALCLSEDGKTVVTGGERGLVIIRWVHSLGIASNGGRKGLESVSDGSNEPDFEPFSCGIRCLALTANERHLLVGLDNGDVRVLAQDSEYLRRKLHRQLIEIGMLSM